MTRKFLILILILVAAFLLLLFVKSQKQEFLTIDGDFASSTSTEGSSSPKVKDIYGDFASVTVPYLQQK